MIKLNGGQRKGVGVLLSNYTSLKFIKVFFKIRLNIYIYILYIYFNYILVYYYIFYANFVYSCFNFTVNLNFF